MVNTRNSVQYYCYIPYFSLYNFFENIYLKQKKNSWHGFIITK